MHEKLTFRKIIARAGEDVYTSLWSGDVGALPGIDMAVCPGHAVDLRVLSFQSEGGLVCVTSDAILNREWLVAWPYC